jgi:type VI secretion system protein ImpH
MADTSRTTDTDLNDRKLEETMIARAPSFSFFQALRLLRQIAARRGHDPRRAVRVRPGLNMSRPQSSVVRISRLGDPESGVQSTENAEGPLYEIETGFLGLYGASSPLPNFYTEDLILAEQEDQNGGRAFLDVFQQRLYDLYLRAQEKHRPLYDLTESADSALLEVLWSMVGLRAPELRRQLPDSKLFLRYLSLFASPRRSAAGLKVMLEDFTGCAVTINQCVRREFRIPVRHRLRLGQARHGLGEGSVLGFLATEFSGRIEVVVGPMSHEVFSKLMNRDQHWPLMISLISYYLRTPLQCDLSMRITAEEARPTELGNEQWGCLGQNTWLYNRAANSTTNGTETLTANIAVA